ncbi:MAG: 30S ribosomal protein S9 [Deltaproteobacteria bacterium]|nr:30S ribosomal protein S9 [Deltaproteobacteria bacterium]
MTERKSATGRRKEANARVWITDGTGKIVVNDRPAEVYFCRAVLMMQIEQPLNAVNMKGKLDIHVRAHGGGLSGQAGAVRHGIARALCSYNPEFRPALKKGGFLTRDARATERKKYGRPGARKRYQFSKR